MAAAAAAAAAIAAALAVTTNFTTVFFLAPIPLMPLSTITALCSGEFLSLFDLGLMKMVSFDF